MATPIPEIDRELEERIGALAMELVEAEWAGSNARPILRLRVDHSDSEPGRGVTVEDCVRVSRALEPWLDEHPGLPEKYTLEVSSPGVERPLHRRRDFERFAGEEVVVKGRGPLADGGSARVEGVLEGVEDAAEEGAAEGYRVLVRLGGEEVIAVPREDIVRARLIFRWDAGA